MLINSHILYSVLSFLICVLKSYSVVESGPLYAFIGNMMYSFNFFERFKKNQSVSNLYGRFSHLNCIFRLCVVDRVYLLKIKSFCKLDCVF
jgi:hypothetical protein